MGNHPMVVVICVGTHITMGNPPDSPNLDYLEMSGGSEGGTLLKVGHEIAEKAIAKRFHVSCP